MAMSVGGSITARAGTVLTPTIRERSKPSTKSTALPSRISSVSEAKSPPSLFSGAATARIMPSKVSSPVYSLRGLATCSPKSSLLVTPSVKIAVHSRPDGREKAKVRMSSAGRSSLSFCMFFLKSFSGFCMITMQYRQSPVKYPPPRVKRRAGADVFKK